MEKQDEEVKEEEIKIKDLVKKASPETSLSELVSKRLRELYKFDETPKSE